MSIRNLETVDVPSVRWKADALAATLYPELISDIDRQNDLLLKAKSDSSWYAKVVGPAGAPTAALVAKTGDNVWATRRHAAIMILYGERGQGSRLLSDFKEWVSGQKSIILAGWSDDFGVDAKTRNMFLKRGFIKRGAMYVYFPRGSKK
jgi:hypothetical protein